jgi:hypothetical protein
MFYTNFEIAKFSFFRSKEYMAYFQHLDKTGNFYYKRWGDAPIHWLGVRMLMDPSKVWAVKDITYQHNMWIKNLNAIPNKEVPIHILQMVDGDDNVPQSRRGRLFYAMNRYIKTGLDGCNWGE